MTATTSMAIRTGKEGWGGLRSAPIGYQPNALDSREKRLCKRSNCDAPDHVLKQNTDLFHLTIMFFPAFGETRPEFFRKCRDLLGVFRRLGRGHVQRFSGMG